MAKKKKEKKQKWIQPKLIVLTRGKPEEKVLETCKYFQAYAGSGAQNQDSVCDIAGCPRAWCSGLGAS